jgi:hypothetical protein
LAVWPGSGLALFDPVHLPAKSPFQQPAYVSTDEKCQSLARELERS